MEYGIIQRNIDGRTLEEESEQVVRNVHKNIRHLVFQKKSSDPTFMQKHLAQQLGITEAELSNYLKVPRNMKVTQVYKFSKALGVTVGQLMEENLGEQPVRDRENPNREITDWEVM